MRLPAKRRSCGPPQRSRDSGFTLLELLVVLAIIALMFAIVPRATAGLAGFRLRAAAEQLADTLRGLHDHAVRSGQTVEFCLNPQERRYTVSGRGMARRLPAIIDAVSILQDSPINPGETPRFRFFPDGSATAGTITLHHDTRQMVVSIEWLTGRVRNRE